MKNNDSVNHPSHYLAHPSGIECIEVTRYMGFCLGNAIKYIWRDGQKAGEDVNDDLRKAIWYIQCEIDRRVEEIESEKEDSATKSASLPKSHTAKFTSPTSPIPQTNPSQFVSESDARVAEFREQMGALAQAHEMWLRDAVMKEERR